MRLWDGTIVESNLMNAPSGDSRSAHYSAVALNIGQVLRVIPIDDSSNISKRYVEYDVNVSEGTTTLTYHNCSMAEDFGSVNDFTESVLQDTINPSDTKLPDDLSGAFVIVACLGGNKDRAIIIKAVQHNVLRAQSKTTKVTPFQAVGSSTSRDAALSTLPTQIPGASSDDGKRTLGEFQGIRWNINKDGEFTLVYQSNKDIDGKLIRPDTGPTVVKINKEGELILLDNLDQEIKISRKDQKIYISSGNETPDFIEIDRANKTINLSAQKNITTYSKENTEMVVEGQMDVTVTGDVNETTKADLNQNVTTNWTIAVGGNAVVDVGGNITAKAGANATINVGGTATVTAGGNVDVTGATITFNGQAGNVLTTVTDPFVDLIFGTATQGVLTVKAG